MTTLQKVILAAIIIALAGIVVCGERKGAQLSNQAETLRQQRASLTEQIQQLQTEREYANNRVIVLTRELANANQDNPELLKLRREIGTFRAQLTAAQNKISDSQQPQLETAREYYNRARTHELNHEYEKQLEDINKAIELDPNMADAYMMRGNLYAHKLPRERGGDEKALADYTRCLELTPNHAAARWNRANTYTRLGRPAEGIADWTTYIEGDTDFLREGEDKTKAIAGAHFWRGHTYQYDLNDYPKAVADYTAALQLDPKREGAHRLRGQCYESLGDMEKAQQDFAIEPKQN